MFLIVRQEKPQDSQKQESPQTEKSKPHVGFVKFQQGPTEPNPLAEFVKFHQTPPVKEARGTSTAAPEDAPELESSADLMLSAIVKLIRDLQELRTRYNSLDETVAVHDHRLTGVCGSLGTHDLCLAKQQEAVEKLTSRQDALRDMVLGHMAHTAEQTDDMLGLLYAAVQAIKGLEERTAKPVKPVKPAKKGKPKVSSILAILGISGLLLASGGCGFFEYDPTLPPLTPTPPGSGDWMGTPPAPTPVGDR